MTAETILKQETEFPSHDSKIFEKKLQTSTQELIASLKSVADDIGQIGELNSEESLLVVEFFSSLLKLMRPLAPSIPVSLSVLPEDLGSVTSAYIDPTGQFVMLYKDGHLELKNLCDQKSRDLMIAVVEDALPKFKNLTSAQKRKVENRIKFMSTVTKEMQKISEALSSFAPSDQE